MNLIRGEISGGRFLHPSGGVMAGIAHSGPAVLGVRPEEIDLAQGQADLTGEVYSSELLGDCLLLSVDIGDTRVIAKLSPWEGREMGSRVGLSLSRARLHLFDAGSGARLGDWEAARQ
jgi:multiple sugar transport system ATP-binding protein